MKHIIIDKIIKQIKGAKSSIFTLNRRKFAMPEIEIDNSFEYPRKLYLAENSNTVFINEDIMTEIIETDKELSFMKIKSYNGELFYIEIGLNDKVIHFSVEKSKEVAQNDFISELLNSIRAIIETDCTIIIPYGICNIQVILKNINIVRNIQKKYMDVMVINMNIPFEQINFQRELSMLNKPH